MAQLKNIHSTTQDAIVTFNPDHVLLGTPAETFSNGKNN